MSLRDAATIPVVYITIYYAFFFYRPISSGKSILIHAGSGGVGLAAIRIALSYGMEVFTTCSTEQKKKFILEEYPQLKGLVKSCKIIYFKIKMRNSLIPKRIYIIPQKRTLEIRVIVHLNT